MKDYKELKDLPNKQGFYFVGVMKDGKQTECYIHNSIDSGFIVLQCHTNKRIFNELKGWRNSPVL